MITPLAVGSGSFPLLQDIARVRAEELGKIQTPEAQSMAEDFRELGASLRSWRPDAPPSPEERSRVKDRLFELNRAAAALIERDRIASGKPPWSRPPPRPR